MIRSWPLPASGHEPFAIALARLLSGQPGMRETRRHPAGSLALPSAANCQQPQQARLRSQGRAALASSVHADMRVMATVRFGATRFT